ncbi:MAG: enoyl-CoA hydratase/isomerase family protein, partial [Bdellovibrionales bacterium]|nr:enoyl-CoA hydratase/isomerase family protein [Bdellovibrionales bacterium]
MITLEFRKPNHTALLHFHHPEGANSFDTKAATELLQICGQLKKNPPRALAWISDHPQFYCTGGDIAAQLKSKSLVSTLKDHLKIRKALGELDALRCPKATLVDGDCYGGGTEILSCFHHVIGTPRALVGLWQRKMGLGFGWGGGARLLRRVPENQIRRLLLSQNTLSVWEAQRLGVIDEVYDRHQAFRRLEEWLEMQGTFGAGTARALPTWSTRTESQVFRTLYGGPDHRDVLKHLSQRKKKS